MNNEDFDIAYAAYTEQFINIINNSNMPLTVTSNVLKDLLSQVTSAIQEKLQNYRN